jgi:hypothetical protein
MAKPKIFLSSTCYDLSIVRTALHEFLAERGFEVINSESPEFGVDPGRHSHSVCINAVKEADYLLLLIGQRRGGSYVGSENSITNEEYLAAQNTGIPCIVCVDRRVYDYRVSYKKNPAADHKHIVDDVRVFHFIDYVASGHSDNWLHPFENLKDLQKILTTQFGHCLSLYSRSLRKADNHPQDDVLVLPFPQKLPQIDKLYKDQDEITSMRNGLRALHELISKIQNSSIKPDAKLEKIKQLFVMSRYGESDAEGSRLTIPFDNFKQHAWSTGRARRVNAQFADFGVDSDFNDDPYDFRLYLRIRKGSIDEPFAWASVEYVKRLVKLHPGLNAALTLFARCDLSCYA